MILGKGSGVSNLSGRRFRETTSKDVKHRRGEGEKTKAEFYVMVSKELGPAEELWEMEPNIFSDYSSKGARA